MRKVTIPEASEILKLPKTEIWKLIQAGTLQTVIEADRLYVLLPKQDEAKDESKSKQTGRRRK